MKAGCITGCGFMTVCWIGCAGSVGLWTGWWTSGWTWGTGRGGGWGLGRTLEWGLELMAGGFVVFPSAVSGVLNSPWVGISYQIILINNQHYILRKTFFVSLQAWDKEKNLSHYVESNLRPSDSALQCSTTKPFFSMRKRLSLSSFYIGKYSL